MEDYFIFSIWLFIVSGLVYCLCKSIEGLTKDIKRILKYALAKKASKIIKEKYERVPNKNLKATGSLLNYKCHQNSYHKARENANYTIARGFLINIEDDEDVIPHFVNYIPKSKVYLDYTYGPYLDQYDFYVVDKNLNLTTSDEADKSLLELSNFKSFLNIKLSFKDIISTI